MTALSVLAPLFFRKNEQQFQAALAEPERAQTTLLGAIAQKLAGSVVARQTGLVSDISTGQLKVLPITRSSDWAQQLESGPDGRPAFGNEPVLKFALTSGTSSTPKKFPITESYLKTYQRFTKTMLLSEGKARGQNLFGHVLGHKNLILSAPPETAPATGESTSEGYNSGMMAKHAPWVLRRMFVPGTEVLSLPTWEEKFQILSREAPKWDLGSISGMPAVIREFLTRVRATQNRPLGEVWPNLKIILVGGGALRADFQDSLNGLFQPKTPLEYLETYFATEGQFAHSLGDPKAGMILNPEAAHFQFLSKAGERHALHEVSQGFEGFIVCSTVSGLVNYQIGDLVRVRSLNPVRVDIIGRENEEISICGDKISLAQCDRAVAMGMGTDKAPFFAVWAEGRNLVFALDAPSDPQLAGKIDAALQSANPIYFENRKNDVLVHAARLEHLEHKSVEAYFQANLDRGHFKGKRLFATRAAFQEEFHARANLG